MITLTTAQNQLTLWVEADAAVATGQSYSIGGRSLTRADARAITEKIDYWQAMVSKLTTGGGARMQRVIPVDR